MRGGGGCFFAILELKDSGQFPPLASWYVPCCGHLLFQSQAALLCLVPLALTRALQTPQLQLASSLSSRQGRLDGHELRAPRHRRRRWRRRGPGGKDLGVDVGGVGDEPAPDKGHISGGGTSGGRAPAGLLGHGGPDPRHVLEGRGSHGGRTRARTSHRPTAAAVFVITPASPVGPVKTSEKGGNRSTHSGSMQWRCFSIARGFVCSI